MSFWHLRVSASVDITINEFIFAILALGQRFLDNDHVYSD